MFLEVSCVTFSDSDTYMFSVQSEDSVALLAANIQLPMVHL